MKNIFLSALTFGIMAFSPIALATGAEVTSGTEVASVSTPLNNGHRNRVPETVGRGKCVLEKGILVSRDSYAVFGESWMTDYRMSFEARAPKDAEQVQIWAGFRWKDRFDRYVVSLKGGLLDDVYLARMGYMGDDSFLGVRPLGFHLEPGEWYRLTVEVCGSRIRVFVGDNPLPYIDVTDPQSSHCPAGRVSLGGSWIETEFRNLSIEPLPADFFEGVRREEVSFLPSEEDREELRKQMRASYSPVRVAELGKGRTEISLDGNWLFQPGYESRGDNGFATASDDSMWHVLEVPCFWTPIRIWLHGETMNTPNGPESKGTSDTYYQQESARCDSRSFDWRKTESAWYRQWIELPDNFEGKKAVLNFDAVAKAAQVYVNGQYAGSHIGMFGDFSIDATSYLHKGMNLVAVKVIRNVTEESEGDDEVVDVAVSLPVTRRMLNDIPHGFHYSCPPAGIWQPVKLVISDPLKIEDVFIKPALDGANFDVSLSNPAAERYEFSTHIRSRQDGSILYSGAVHSGSEENFSFCLDGLEPQLWSPDHPNLYDFSFSVRSMDGTEAAKEDKLTICSGFRTFEVRDGFFYLNGVRYWLRGGNHIPAALRPEDKELADTFMQLMKQGHMDVVRTHTAPWNELWTDAADRNGIAVSHEGGWPWLMIQGDIPPEESLEIWRQEELDMVRKYRNHPSIIFWTVNNEMNFYESDPDLERAKDKYRVVSDLVQRIRETDPTRPVCFDSNYRSRGKVEKFGADFMASVDVGDIDDIHQYYNWYHDTVFQQFNGEFQQVWKTPGRCIISQELSTGYPNNETGHPTRAYQITHQNPMSLVGYKGYDWADPAYFLEAISFGTGESAEALRRTNPEAAGFLHFALMTWFRQCYDAEKIEPYPVYHALSRALQPVLVSAELWGRHQWEGEKLTNRICVVNDLENGETIRELTLRWEIVSSDNKILASGESDVPDVEGYGRAWTEPEIILPVIDKEREDALLRLKLSGKGTDGNRKQLSENEYKLLICSRAFARHSGTKCKAGQKLIALGKVDQLDEAGIRYRQVGRLGKPSGRNILVCDGNLPEGTAASDLRRWVEDGGRLILLYDPKFENNCPEAVFPEYLTGRIRARQGDICFMERNEDPVFDGIEEMDLRYFNDNTRSLPQACSYALKTMRCPEVEELAGYMNIHAYIDGTPEARMNKIREERGFTLLRIKCGRGSAFVSTLRTDKAGSDPVAAKLLAALCNEL